MDIQKYITDDFKKISKLDKDKLSTDEMESLLKSVIENDDILSYHFMLDMWSMVYPNNPIFDIFRKILPSIESKITQTLDRLPIYLDGGNIENNVHESLDLFIIEQNIKKWKEYTNGY